MKWTLGIGGALAGFVGMAVYVAGVDIWLPGWPAGNELLLQGAIVIFMSSLLGGLGFCLGCLIDLCRRIMGREGGEI